MIEYVAIDLETSGLYPENGHQILEIGAVHSRDGREFHKYVRWKEIYGHPIALDMNAAIIKRGYEEGIPIGEAIQSLMAFCIYDGRNELIVGKDGKPWRVVPAGKNFDSFDRQFLIAAGLDVGFFTHRCMDPSILFECDSDEKPPDLKTCLLRAGLADKFVLHTALDDAKAVHALIQYGRRNISKICL